MAPGLVPAPTTGSTLARRAVDAEEMDDPQLDPARHAHALDGLARINRWSASARRLWSAIRPLAGAGRAGPLRILDVASGAGDVPLALWRKAARDGVDLALSGCDLSPTAIAHARARAERAGAPIAFTRLDALHDALPTDQDVLTCSLFLHHLSDEDAIVLLRRLADATKWLLVVSDLERTRMGYALAWVGTRLLTRSPVVHADGPLSVRRAFTLREAEALASQAGLAGASIKRCWPSRWLLTWERP